MEITTPSAAPPAALANSGAQTSGVLSSDFETFLKMLTAQARYQDPLEPIDSSEYAAQLAQFSMVEQQVKSNDLLSALAQQMGAGNMTQTASWIGMEALTNVPTYFDGRPIELTPNPAAAADQVALVVRDSNGAEVQRLPLPVSAEPVTWAGVSDDGSPFPNGTYRFDIESRAKERSF
ncbi:MAG: flagellar hook capping FlgD N-terminal domain-containing protein [Sulfitobacter sp.]|nr:flagellar hook capping FlgD N-terminal domain-containing protein [Sulfitobacter sp.]